MGAGHVADVVGAFFMGNGIVANGALVLRVELDGLGGGSEGRRFLGGSSEGVLREGVLEDAALVKVDGFKGGGIVIPGGFGGGVSGHFVCWVWVAAGCEGC